MNGRLSFLRSSFCRYLILIGVLIFVILKVDDLMAGQLGSLGSADNLPHNILVRVADDLDLKDLSELMATSKELSFRLRNHRRWKEKAEESYRQLFERIPPRQKERWMSEVLQPQGVSLQEYVDLEFEEISHFEDRRWSWRDLYILLRILSLRPDEAMKKKNRISNHPEEGTFVDRTADFLESAVVGCLYAAGISAAAISIPPMVLSALTLTLSPWGEKMPSMFRKVAAAPLLLMSVPYTLWSIADSTQEAAQTPFEVMTQMKLRALRSFLENFNELPRLTLLPTVLEQGGVQCSVH